MPQQVPVADARSLPALLSCSQSAQYSYHTHRKLVGNRLQEGGLLLVTTHCSASVALPCAKHDTSV